MSLSLLAMIASNGSLAPRDTVRLSLEASSACWFRLVKQSGYAVAFGCALEAPETVVIIKRWWLLKFKNQHRDETIDDKKKWHIPLGPVGLLVIVIGIFLETYAEGKVSDIDGQIRSHESEKITAAESVAGIAVERVAEEGKDTEGLKADTANAKRDMVKAQLELARLTGPIQSVPIINGIATPDPTKGLRLRVLLHGDARIKLPTLSRGKAVTWTLFITQDEKGNRQFSTFPHDLMFGYFLYHPPRSSCTMELVTDEHGTTDLTFGAASCPSNATGPTSK